MSVLVFWLALAALAVTCLAATGARSLEEFSRHELEEICRRRKSPRLGEILRRHDQAALAATTLQVIATGLFAGAATLWIWNPAGREEPPAPLSLTFEAAGAILLLLAAELWIPWAVVRLYASAFIFHTWPFWKALGMVLHPLGLCARFVDTFLHRVVGRTPEKPNGDVVEEEIRAIVTEGHREGLLEEDAREMIEGVIELSDVDVSEVMTPRTEMVSMPVTLSWQEALEFVIQTGHTRIPVHEKDRDDIIGILHAKDLLPELTKGPDQPVKPWAALLREPYFVPETKPVDVLLQEFQKTRNHIAVVLDEYGGVSGLVTIEDVLEEIVGEIVDEYDKDLVDGLRQISENEAEALGKVHLDEINDRLGTELPDEEEYDTIGGFVFSELGRIPEVGEQLLWNNLRITVVDATRRRIERVKIEILDRNQRESA